jgi:hypothetical protein
MLGRLTAKPQSVEFDDLAHAGPRPLPSWPAPAKSRCRCRHGNP